MQNSLNTAEVWMMIVILLRSLKFLKEKLNAMAA